MSHIVDVIIEYRTPQFLIVKRIAVLNGQNTYNYGSFMMLINFMHYLQKYRENNSVEYLIHCNTPADYYRVCKALSDHAEKIHIKPLYVYCDARKKGLLSRAYNRYKKLYWAYKVWTYKPDIVVVLGGDDISECYSKTNWIGKLITLTLLSLRARIFLVGQTIGPFFSWRVWIARQTLRTCRICVRDPLSYAYCTEKLKLGDVTLSADLALLNLPNQEKNRCVYKKFGLTKGNYVTVVLSGLVKHYARDMETYAESWATVIRQVAQRADFSNKKIVLLAHVLAPANNDDRRALEAVYKKFPKQWAEENIVIITCEMFPSEARSILGNGYCTISSRMHAGISSLQMGIPAIFLSYSMKYKGVLSEGLGLDELVIEAKNARLWNNADIASVLLQRIETTLRNPLLREQLPYKIGAAQKLALVQIEEVARFLRQICNTMNNKAAPIAKEHIPAYQ